MPNILLEWKLSLLMENIINGMQSIQKNREHKRDYMNCRNYCSKVINLKVLQNSEW